jgi:hypothetical protein
MKQCHQRNAHDDEDDDEAPIDIDQLIIKAPLHDRDRIEHNWSGVRRALEIHGSKLRKRFDDDGIIRKVVR